MNATGAAFVIAEEEIVLSEQPSIVDLPHLATVPGAMIFATITALDADVCITGAQWVTLEPPKQKVSLAVVVTTFKREQAAIATIGRFAETTIPKCQNGTIHLYVIDNGRTLEAVEQPGAVTIIPNNNLGGAGGFTRGLMEVTQASRFTHVLFMDDDASCEPESVWRTIALLSRVVDKKTAVAGAMLFTDRPTIQYEKGAVFLPDGGIRSPFWSLNHHWDISDAVAVVNNDHPDIANYGGWWFFAFPISEVKKLPFPFFVRGDDTDFSVVNGFPIATLNGVATWCDNFGYKLTPSVEYLATRSWMALALMHGNDVAAKSALKFFLRHAMTLGLRFDYASMSAVLDAIEHALKGPDLFGENPAPIDHLKKVNGSRSVAKMTAEDFALLANVPPRKGLKRLLDKISLGGHIGPAPRRRVIPHTRIAWEVPRWGLSRVNKVAYGRGTDAEIYSRDRAKMKDAVVRLLKLSLIGSKRIKSLLSVYREETDKYRSHEYWTSQFYDRNNG